MPLVLQWKLRSQNTRDNLFTGNMLKEKGSDFKTVKGTKSVVNFLMFD